jgi:hypothetical protein
MAAAAAGRQRVAGLAAGLAAAVAGGAGARQEGEREGWAPALGEWLQEQGARMSGVAVKPSGSGLGLLAAGQPGGRLRWLKVWRWGKEEALAEFPLGSAITAQTVAADPDVGELYSKWLDLGILNERQVVVMFLLTERAKGSSSSWAPYIQSLPSSHDIPLFLSDRAASELKGTSLEHAAATQRQEVDDEWRVMAPLAADALNQGGAGALRLSQQDFQWARATYWSRALALGQGENGPEGLVPGLDFANHAPLGRSKARWQVDEQANSVKLLGVPSKRNSEITISYGDKSNEELMFMYGFAIRDNPDDKLMVPPPLPADTSQWDASASKRMNLVQQAGEDARSFLPRRGAQTRQQARDTVESVLPKLQAFVMDDRELSVARDKPEVLTEKVSDGERRFATLTLLSSMLESKVNELEGATGPAANDESLLSSGTLDRRRSNCVVYRLGQKELAKSYLSAAKEMLREAQEQRGSSAGSPASAAAA